MCYPLFAFLIVINLSLAAQVESMQNNKLPGNNFLDSDFRYQNGEELPDTYKKTYTTVENGDSIKYLEKYHYDKEWSVTRYLIKNNKNVLSGWQQFFNMDGTLQYELFCEDGKKNCKTMLRYAWYPGGQLLAIGHYYKSQPNGSYYYYYSNGQMRQHAYYEKGKFMEVLAYYDQNGNAVDAGTLCNGEGIANVYSVDGVLIQIKSFSNGKLRKTVTLGIPENQNIH